MPRLSLPLNYNWAETYIDGDQVEATNGKTMLPAIKHLTFDKELPGGVASYPSPRFEKTEGQILVSMPTSDALIYALQYSKIRKLNIQAGFQEENLETGELDDHTISYAMDVTLFGTDEQDIEPNSEGEIPMPYEAKSIKITIDSVVIVQIDKRLGTNIVNNEDLARLARIAFGAI